MSAVRPIGTIVVRTRDQVTPSLSERHHSRRDSPSGAVQKLVEKLAGMPADTVTSCGGVTVPWGR